MTTKEILLLLQARSFRFNRQLGQNFLIDDGVLGDILDQAQIAPGDRVLEIGAGAGCLTNALASRGARVLAVEIDTDLLPVLEIVLRPYPEARILHADALKLDVEAACREMLGPGPFKVVSNLPYGITTPVMLRLLKEPLPISRQVLMLQDEAADRVLSPPGRKAYGPLAIWTAYRTRACRAFRVPAHCFVPPPHVGSAVLRLDARDGPPFPVGEERVFSRLVDAAFAMRRKTLLNNLGPAFGVKRPTAARWLQACGLPADVRGEALSPEQLGALSCEIAENAAFS